MDAGTVDLIVGVCAPALTAVAMAGVGALFKRVGIQQDAADNAAIQAAVQNVAGTFAHKLADGTLNRADAAKLTMGYLEENLPAVITRVQPSLPTIMTMMLGKAAAIAGPAADTATASDHLPSRVS